MFESSSEAGKLSMGKRGSRLPPEETDFTKNFIVCARALWPKKTAASWAAAAGVTDRMVKYWLARTHEVSDSGKMAVLRQLQ